RALAHRPLTLPGVSAPSSVVRSTIRTAISRAHSLDSRLMDLVASAAARSCAPTWSTPGSPCSARRSAASEASAPLTPGTGGAATPGRPPPRRRPPPPGPWARPCGRAGSRPPPHPASLRGRRWQARSLPPQAGNAHHRVAGRPGRGEPRLDHRVDDAQPLVEVPEGALHRVDREPLDVRPAVAERLDEPVELRGERDAAHQPV